jgi:hypothetical protein
MVTIIEYEKYVIEAGKELSENFNIEINNSLPYILICRKSDNKEWFFQGEEASNLLDEVPENFNSKEYILYYLDSAGLFC